LDACAAVILVFETRYDPDAVPDKDDVNSRIRLDGVYRSGSMLGSRACFGDGLDGGVSVGYGCMGAWVSGESSKEVGW
jgi:hypothetical protein